MGRDRRLDELRRDAEAVYRERLPELVRVAAATSGSREAAPDLVQEAFARALRELASFDGRGSFDGWLWRIVTNVALNHRRDRRVHAELSEVEGVSAGDDDLREEITRAVASLPEQQRLVLFLRYYGDLDYRTIGEALGISSGTVGATLAAARNAVLDRVTTKEAAG